MFRYTSVLNPEYSDALERLMFFNPGQKKALAAIMNSVENYGSPDVYTEGECLRVKIEKLEDVQTLFVLDDDRLVGVLIYSRVLFECLTVIHIAVDQDYSSHGRFSRSMLVMRMLELLRNSARCIKGVKAIRIMHSGNQIRDYTV